MKNLQRILGLLCTFIIYSAAQEISAESAMKCQPDVAQYLNQKIMQATTKYPPMAPDSFELTNIYTGKLANVTAARIPDITKATILQCDNAYEKHRDFRLFACEYNIIKPKMSKTKECLERLMKETDCDPNVVWWATCLIKEIEASSTIADAENPVREYYYYENSLTWDQTWQQYWLQYFPQYWLQYWPQYWLQYW